MSGPRALKPFLGAGSRLLVDQLVLPCRSASTTTTTTKLVITRPRAPILSTSSSTICLRCSFTLNHRQVRLSSTKPPNNGNKDGPPPYEIPKFDDVITPPPPPPPPREDAESNNNNKNTTGSTPSSSTTTTEKEPPPPPPPSPPPPPPHHEDLPSAQNSRRSALNQSLSLFMDRAQTTLFAASQRINDLTGYSGIETLKQEISSLEASLAAAQSTLHNCRTAYKAAVSSRSATQREVTTLLARQKTWTPVDFERFTQLYRQDYELDASVSDAARALEAAERDAEQVARDLNARILARYHEEQIWSDKIRRMSTWGTWGLMSVNVLLFLVFQFGAEPWRRARLVRGFEAKVREALEEERVLTAAVVEARQEEAWTRRITEVSARRGESEAVEETEGEPVAAVIEGAEGETTARSTPVVSTPGEEVPEEVTIISGEPVTMGDFWRRIFHRTTPWREFLADTGRWKAAFAELCSDRQVSVRMRDLSIVALEGVAAGAFFAGSVAIFFLRRT